MNSISFLRKNTWSVGTGWGNGYVAVPKEHPMYGLTDEQINKRYKLDVVGQITWAKSYHSSKNFAPVDTHGMWIIGFDTAHSWCDSEYCNKEFVKNELESLKKQIDALAGI